VTRATVPGVVLAAFVAIVPSAHAVRDFSSIARNIIPSGQYGGAPPVSQADEQARLYDGLTPLFDKIKDNDLNRYFKSEKLGTKGQGPLTRERVPRNGVDLLLFQRLTRGKIRNARDFIKAAAISPQTFNTFYADSDEVAQITTGRLPLRAKGVDSGLPTDGRGNFEWRGWLPAKDHPQAIKRGGVLNNWNNKPALGFPAADDQWAYGSIQRVDLLNRNTNKLKSTRWPRSPAP
jgi:hypothetical protein